MNWGAALAWNGLKRSYSTLPVSIWLVSGATGSGIISFHGMRDTVNVKQWVPLRNSMQWNTRLHMLLPSKT